VFVVDTNVFLYAANADAPEHEACTAKLLAWRSDRTPWFVTWPIVYEFLRVSTHRRVFRAPLTLEQAWSFADAVISSRSIGVLAPSAAHRETLADLVANHAMLAGNVLHDLHTAALMREHGIRTIVTRDTDFHVFDFLEVIDPLS
jgi:toxin-antitoxin system PIN domain toxin